MNDQPQNSADETLHRLLTTAIGPDVLNDEEIESLLNSSERSLALSDEQTQRIVGKVSRLLNAAAKTSASGATPTLQVDQRPRLVSATSNEPPRPIRIPAIAALLASMLALVSVIVLTPGTSSKNRISEGDQRRMRLTTMLAPRYRMTAKPSPDAAPLTKVVVGDEIATGDLERRRVILPDGSVLYVNSGSQVKIATERRVEVTRGEVFVEVVPAFDRASHSAQSSRHSLSDEPADPATPTIVTQRVTATLPFEVVTPDRTVTALGTKFSVSVEKAETDVMVTQGKVKVSGVEKVVAAGQQVKAAGEYTFASAPRASAALEWTRDLMAAATGPLVPKSEYSGGALVTVDPNGQSSQLSLRNYHIDVHIEDGFARTTIDQTYFNHTHSRLEGTFHFPLPTDASLSRLAMYVNGKLMEGGMAERDHARNTFEEIKRKMLDPALLEWVDGSTFKMRVFPLEPRQEKRIVLSYSQRLNSAEGQLSYRFPAGHTMDAVRDWSAHVRIKGGAGSEWRSQSHTMTATEDTGDLVLDAALKNALMDRDLVLKVVDSSDFKSQISNLKSEGQQYLMLRLRPELPGELQRQPHHWVFLFEHAGDRSPLLARAQIEIIRTLLENAEHTDTFSIVSASTRAELYPAECQRCTAENTAAAMQHLEHIHLVGALDLAAAFRKCGEQIAHPHLLDDGLVPRTRVLVHVGSGLPALGERDAAKLAAMIPADAQYVGIGVGRRWNQAMMKQAASRTGGLSTQINPDEEIAWRAFDVFSKLHSPRLVNVRVEPTTSAAENAMRSGPNGPTQPLPVASATGIDPLRMKSPERAAEIICCDLCRAFSPFCYLAMQPGPHGPGNGFVGPSGPESQAAELSITKVAFDTPQFLLFSDTITQGEELAAICRVPEGQPLPASVTVTATLNGQPWAQTIPVANVKVQATYLPRHWAKLEIERLLAENTEQHREAIVALSKSMYVMSPFTSLLVLENDEMYTQFNIDRGRKDHWALYPCPEQIEVVVENGGEAAPSEVVTADGPKTPANVMSTITRIQRPQWFKWNLPQMLLVNGSVRYVVPQSGVEADVRFPQAQYLNYFMYHGTSDFGVGSGNGSLNHWGRQQHDNMWFEDNADSYWLDTDDDGDGIPANNEERFATFVDHYNVLLKEKRFAEAELLAKKAKDLNADSAEAVLMVEKAKLYRQNYFNQEFGTRPADSFTHQLNDVDFASVIPFGEYTLPKAKLWRELPERRNKYDRVNNRDRTEGEIRIESALSQRSSLHFHDAPLTSVIRHIANEHGINIAIRTEAIETEGLAVNPLVNIDVDGITLKSSLNLLLDQAGGLAYSIEDDTLMITTEEEQKATRNDRQAASDVGSFLAWRMQNLRWEAGAWMDDFDPAVNLRGELNSEAMPDIGLLILKGNEGDVARVQGLIENLERESLADSRLPALLFEDKISLGERPSSRLSEEIELRRFGMPAPGSGTEDGFFFRGIEPAGEEVRGRFWTQNLSRGGIRLLSPEQQEVRITRQNSPGSHRWSADSVIADTELVKLPTFQTPSPHPLGVNAILFGDLISHAPGLNTSPADVLAVVEAESVAEISNLKFQISNPPAGRVDDAARVLIEKSRSRGWESITLPGREGEAGITIHYDGSGRHAWERVVSESLREHVVCDGTTQWHVYREIGLASKRQFSRFHHREFTAIVPWLLPSVDALARGANLVAVDQRTVAIVPMATQPASGGSQPSGTTATESGQLPAASAVPLMIHLMFAEDGRLAERRIVEQASDKILHRITYDADGTIRILDADDKELASLNLHRSTAAAPQLVQELNGLVVLPMPVRTPEVIKPKEIADVGQVGLQDADLSEDDAVSLMLAYMANGNGARMVEIARKRFIDKGDTRDGIYVLLSRFPQALVQEAIPGDATAGSAQTPGFDLRPPVEGSPLKQFVRQYMNWLRAGDDANEFRIDAPEGSFLQRMATARNLYVRWLTDTATKDLTQAQVRQEVDRTLDFIASCRTPDMGWSLMSVMRPRLNTPEFLAAYSRAAERFEQHPQIGLLVRRERITALFAAGKHDEGRILFKEWLHAHFEQGIVPPIGTELYNACISGDGQKQIDELLLESAKRLVDAQLLMTLHSMSVQMRELGNTHIADQMMTLLLTALDASERPDVSLYAIEQLRRMKDPRADKLLDQVMEHPMAEQIPGLWRFASKLAEDSGRKRLAAERLERAIQLEFATRPTVINIQTVRSDYGEMLAKYEELITASTTLELAPPADLAACIVQAVDQWRTLDDDDTAACQTASRLLAKLNSKELAWDYLTTPLAENSGESAPWIALGRSLGTDTQTDLADMAWTQAFELESTNPEILLEHARMLQAAGRVVPARVLLKRAVDGTWQPRFANSVQQCRDLLKSF